MAIRNPHPQSAIRYGSTVLVSGSLGSALYYWSRRGLHQAQRDHDIPGIELNAEAVNLSFVSLSGFFGERGGQLFVSFVMTVAAAEAAVGLAIFISVFRNRESLNVDEVDSLKL